MDKKLLEKYFLGKCNSKEEAKVVAWLETMKGDLYDLSAIEEAWNNFEISEEAKSTWDSRVLLKEITTQIGQDSEQGKHVVLPQVIHGQKNGIDESQKSKNWRARWGIAATISLLLMACGLFFFNQLSNDDLLAEKSPKSTLITRTTEKGQRITLKLSDGTSVKLNASSSITFPRNFAEGKRQITLIGEAFFDVAHDSTRPFEVLTGDLKTTVLGTSFNVQAYPELNKMSIALVTGKVSVHNKNKNAPNAQGDTVILAPSEELVYDKEKEQMATKPLDEDLVAWKSGILVFKSASLDEISKTLEKWYGVEIAYPKRKYSALRFTGKFDNKSLQHVIEGIQLTAGFKFKLEEKQLIIE